MAFPVKVNAGVFAKTFVHRKAERGIQGICDRIGSANMEILIKHDKPLSLLVPPSDLDDLSKKARQFSWAAKLISDDEFVRMLPDWVREKVKANGEQGNLWLGKQIEWLRGLFEEP